MSPEVLAPPTDPPPAPPVRRLSDDFRDLLRSAAGRDVTLGELEHKLQGRGFALFILLLSLPFCFPIAIPGLSIGFGIVIMLLGIRIALGRKPQLPDFILRKEIKHKTLERIVGFGLKLCQRMEKVARPRMQFLRDHPGAVKLIGIGLASGGVQLLLPLPPLIPLSNTIPAVSVVLLTIGLIERDGIFVLCGYFVNLCAWAYFWAMFAAAEKGIEVAGKGIEALFKHFH
jgi:hypothetical protein